MLDYFTVRDEYRPYLAEARRARAEVFARFFRWSVGSVRPRRRNAEAAGDQPGAAATVDTRREAVAAGQTTNAEATAAATQALTRAMHELRTPLASVRGFAEILTDDPDLPRPQRQRFAAAIVTEAERLSAIIETISGAAQVGTDRWCVPDDAFEQALARLRAEAAKEFDRDEAIRDPVAA